MTLPIPRGIPGGRGEATRVACGVVACPPPISPASIKQKVVSAMARGMAKQKALAPEVLPPRGLGADKPPPNTLAEFEKARWDATTPGVPI